MTDLKIEIPLMIGDKAVCFLVVVSSVIAVLFGLAITLLAVLSNGWRSVKLFFERTFGFLERNLSIVFVFTWLFGFGVYCVGMYVAEGDAVAGDFIKRLLCVMPMGVIHAFEMFLLESDVSAVHEEFHSNLLFMTLFSLAHFLAAMVSLMFVIKHFGHNIASRVIVVFTSRCPFGRYKSHDELYVFWGQNEASYRLATSIIDKLKDEKPQTGKHRYRMLFVRTADGSDDTAKRTGLDRLLSFMQMKNSDFDRFRRLNCWSIEAFRRLSKCEVSQEEQQNHNAKILKQQLNLGALVRYINKTTSTVHIFMLGDDEYSNIKALCNLCADASLNKYVEPQPSEEQQDTEKDDKNKSAKTAKTVIIYCHAREDSVNRTMESIHSSSQMEVRIIDSAHLAIEMLKNRRIDTKTNKRESLILPVDYVTVNSDATVNEPFNAMVIGFGQCGRDAVKFLYEYAAFARKVQGKAGEVVRRSPFCCDVFDCNMNETGTIFRMSRPAASISPVRQDIASRNNDELINLYQTNVNDELFWQIAERKITTENYIVIAVKDDELGITLAVRLLKLAIRKGTNLERFRIFVRSYAEDKLPYLERIANFYNESVKASHNLSKNKKPIYVFGNVSEIYTWDNIVNDRIRKEAIRYYNCYENKFIKPGEAVEKYWKARRDKVKAANYPYGSLNGLRRSEMQDMENAWHRDVKTELAKRAMNNDNAFNRFIEAIANGTIKPKTEKVTRDGKEEEIRTTLYLERTDSSKDEWTLLPDDQRKQILDTLAHTEHLRWLASHEMLGYQPGKCAKEQRDILFVHDCVVPWEQIKASEPWASQEETKGYDYKVVDVSFKLKYEDKQNGCPSMVP